MSINKISPAEKLAAVKRFLNGKGSQRSIATHMGIRYQSFQQWIRNYKSMGFVQSYCDSPKLEYNTNSN